SRWRSASRSGICPWLLCQGRRAGGRVAVDHGAGLGDEGRVAAGVCRGRLEELEDAAGEVAFEAAQCFSRGLAFCLFAGEVGSGLGVDASLGDGDAVQGAVELAVAAAVQAVAV